MTKYLVFDWELQQDQASIKERAKYSGGVLIEVVTLVELERQRVEAKREGIVEGMKEAARIVEIRGVLRGQAKELADTLRVAAEEWE